jgi:hypothetical protein
MKTTKKKTQVAALPEAEEDEDDDDFDYTHELTKKTNQSEVELFKDIECGYTFYLLSKVSKKMVKE